MLELCSCRRFSQIGCVRHFISLLIGPAFTAEQSDGHLRCVIQTTFRHLILDRKYLTEILLLTALVTVLMREETRGKRCTGTCAFRL